MRISASLLILLALFLVSCGGEGSGDNAGAGAQTATSGPTASKLQTVTIHASGGKRVEVKVEIADDLPEQERGLMYRTALGEDRGMLFVYKDEEVRSFWMKNTLIPLSIAYIDAQGRIIDLQDMKPLDDKPPHYVSAEPAQYALEVNQGFFKEHGVKVGDRADLPV